MIQAHFWRSCLREGTEVRTQLGGLTLKEARVPLWVAVAGQYGVGDTLGERVDVLVYVGDAVGECVGVNVVVVDAVAEDVADEGAEGVLDRETDGMARRPFQRGRQCVGGCMLHK